MRNYLVNKILDKYERSKKDWNNRQNGGRNFRIQQSEYDNLQKLLSDGTYEGYGSCSEIFMAEAFDTGKECILAEARWLEKQSLITIKWFSYGNDIEKIGYSLENISEFYKIADRKPKFVLTNKKSEQLKKYWEQAESEWLKQYYYDRIEQAERGKEIESDEADERLFQCLHGIERLQFPMYIRTFSTKYKKIMKF